MKSKLVSMKDAIAAHVHDGDTVVIEGFTHLICFAAGHEIIRQGRKDLTICRLTPDLIYDQMIGAGWPGSWSSPGPAIRAPVHCMPSGVRWSRGLRRSRSRSTATSGWWRE